MTALASLAFDWKDQVIVGDSVSVLKQLPSDYVDLVVTSPPYADSRKNTYGGVHPDKYVEWFLPFTEELFRVLKPTGTFILTIKARTVRGERHTYVIEGISEMRKQGWLWAEACTRHKKSCHPGKCSNRVCVPW